MHGEKLLGNEEGWLGCSQRPKI